MTHTPLIQLLAAEKRCEQTIIYCTNFYMHNMAIDLVTSCWMLWRERRITPALALGGKGPTNWNLNWYQSAA